MIGMNTEQRFCVVGTILDSEATHELVAAEATVQLVVTSLHVVGAGPLSMETMWVGDSSGSTKIIRTPSTIPDRGDEYGIGPLIEGVALTKGESLVITSNAGPGTTVTVVAEGYKLRS